MGAQLSLHHNDDSFLTVHQYVEEGDPPILVLNADGVHVSLSVAKRDQISEGDLRFARRLAEATQAYLAACTQAHAAQQAGLAEAPA